MHQEGGEIALQFCLPGLETLQRDKGSCRAETFQGPDKGVFGARKRRISAPVPKQDCSSAFGELYVFLSCSGLCENAACPLTKVTHEVCINIRKTSRIFTLTEDSELTAVYREKGAYYTGCVLIKSNFT